MIVADLIPAESPYWKSVTTALKFFSSHQRVIILMSIPAQSHDSVPPAPALIVTIALLGSVSPERRAFFSASDKDVRSLGNRSTASAIEASSPSSPISQRTSKSSARFLTLL